MLDALIVGFSNQFIWTVIGSLAAVVIGIAFISGLIGVIVSFCMMVASEVTRFCNKRTTK